ncbi:succinate dehydrogenase assembly factor 2-A [Striga asiatica]|uniref:Succinate dehydrogenase assembly factor 2-A n=1 Tax=Striga asiatica TaxID=4170 RepID=A0A5A7PIL9_STRAF|nr:succinate dehydrogenase assembly factor 2-A [Striga asiatica]
MSSTSLRPAAVSGHAVISESTDRLAIGSVDGSGERRSHNLQTKQVNDDDKDTLSLSNFPLNPNEPVKSRSSTHKTQDGRRRSTSEPSDFFEFFTDFNSEPISHADDIIFRGKLVPFGNHQFLKSLSAHDATRFSGRPPWITGEKNVRRRRDCVRSESGEIRQSCSGKSDGSSRVSRPRWFVLMFGPPRLAEREMDIREMRRRWGRRAPESMFPVPAEGRGIGTGRRWFKGMDLVRMLSCRSHGSVVVAASIGALPPRF